MCTRASTVVRHAVAVTLVASILVSGGCAGREAATLAWFPVHRSPSDGLASGVKQVVPESAVYKVKFATQPDAGPEDYHTYGGARRVLRRGDVVGFQQGEDGRVYAIAGREAFPLRPRRGGRVPAYLVWSYKPASRHSGGGIDGALVDLWQFAVGTSVVVAATALWLWAELHDRDDRRSRNY